MTARSKLSAREIWLLLFIYERCGLCGRTTLKPHLRPWVVGLWRRHLVEIWFRCVPDEGISHGPFFNLTVDGHHLASTTALARETAQGRKVSRRSSSPSSEPPPIAA